MTDAAFELAQARWHEVMRKVASLMQKRELAAAIFELDAFLSDERQPELRSDALGFRADLKQELGQLDSAKDDLLQARALVGPSYGRYVSELCLGRVCEAQQRVDEAASWYRTALRTCAAGRGISGGTALSGFLELQYQESLTREDQTLVTDAALASWGVLDLPGKPDTTNWVSVVSAIKSAEAGKKR